MKDAPPRLESPEDFGRFSIAMDERLKASAVSALAPVADPTSDEVSHAWVRPDAVRALSPMAGDPVWADSFGKMCAYAETKGWTGPNGSLRAHIDLIPTIHPVSPDDFRNAMRKFASGVCIVAAGEGEARRGMTVSAFTSVSAEPPMILVCLNRSASSYAALSTAKLFSVNILSGTQEDVALTFAGRGGLTGADRFDDQWVNADGGVPVLTTSHQSLVCTPVSAQIAGTHTVLIGQVTATSDASDGPALMNYDGVIKTTSVPPVLLQ